MSIAMPAADHHAIPSPSPTAETPRPVVDAAGRLRAQGLTDGERNVSIALHLIGLAGLVLSPLFIVAIIAGLVLWLNNRTRSPFVDDHGRELVNFGASYLIWTILLGWTVVLAIVLFVVAFINLIRGAMAAGNGEFFRYPLTIRFLS